MASCTLPAIVAACGISGAGAHEFLSEAWSLLLCSAKAVRYFATASAPQRIDSSSCQCPKAWIRQESNRPVGRGIQILDLCTPQVGWVLYPGGIHDAFLYVVIEVGIVDNANTRPNILHSALLSVALSDAGSLH